MFSYKIRIILFFFTFFVMFEHSYADKDTCCANIQSHFKKDLNSYTADEFVKEIFYRISNKIYNSDADTIAYLNVVYYDLIKNTAEMKLPEDFCENIPDCLAEITQYFTYDDLRKNLDYAFFEYAIRGFKGMNYTIKYMKHLMANVKLDNRIFKGTSLNVHHFCEERVQCSDTIHRDIPQLQYCTGIEDAIKFIFEHVVASHVTGKSTKRYLIYLSFAIKERESSNTKIPEDFCKKNYRRNRSDCTKEIEKYGFENTTIISNFRHAFLNQSLESLEEKEYALEYQKYLIQEAEIDGSPDTLYNGWEPIQYCEGIGHI